MLKLAFALVLREASRKHRRSPIVFSWNEWRTKKPPFKPNVDHFGRPESSEFEISGPNKGLLVEKRSFAPGPHSYFYRARLLVRIAFSSAQLFLPRRAT